VITLARLKQLNRVWSDVELSCRSVSILVTSIQFHVTATWLELYIMLSFEGMGYNSRIVTILLQLHWAMSLNLAGQVQQQPAMKDKESSDRHLPCFHAAPAVQR
jgi:hypothetical protein